MSDFGRVQFTAPLNYNHIEAELASMLVAFKDRFREDFYVATAECDISGSLIEMIEKLKEPITDARTNFLTSYCVVLSSDQVMVTVRDENAKNNPWDKGKRNISVASHGRADLVQAVTDKAKQFPRVVNPRVSWNYLIKGERHQSSVFLEDHRDAPDLFYPYIEGGLDTFFNDFMESSAAILLLRGEPGTGKTSFINKLIWQKNLDTMITYEDALFKSDQLFVEFLTNRRINLLIMEDADALIMSRERHGNEVMSKFLNISDGLLRFKKKKIIITSNVIDEDRIDGALLRRGRCYAAPLFRKLTFEESKAAAEAANKELPVMERDYSLAEILNGPGKSREVRRVGFMGGQAVA